MTSQVQRLTKLSATLVTYDDVTISIFLSLSDGIYGKQVWSPTRQDPIQVSTWNRSNQLTQRLSIRPDKMGKPSYRCSFTEWDFNFHSTRQNPVEINRKINFILHSYRRENLKSYLYFSYLQPFRLSFVLLYAFNIFIAFPPFSYQQRNFLF
jgi:hypothetical protein